MGRGSTTAGPLLFFLSTRRVSGAEELRQGDSAERILGKVELGLSWFFPCGISSSPLFAEKNEVSAMEPKQGAEAAAAFPIHLPFPTYLSRSHTAAAGGAVPLIPNRYCDGAIKTTNCGFLAQCMPAARPTRASSQLRAPRPYQLPLQMTAYRLCPGNQRSARRTQSAPPDRSRSLAPGPDPSRSVALTVPLPLLLPRTNASFHAAPFRNDSSPKRAAL